MTDEKREQLLEIKDKMIAEFPDENFKDFAGILYNSGYFNNIPKEDIEWVLIDNCGGYGFSISTLKWDNIEIGIDFLDDKIRVGIDPIKCFDKTSKCSIIAWFPMSKREYKRFVGLFNKVTDRKMALSVDWFKRALGCWSGQFAEFGA